MQSQEQEGGEGRFAAWWCPDYQNLGGGGRDGGIAWDGEVSSWHAGADARIGPGLIAGVSFSRSRGAFDYQGVGPNLAAGRGTYELGLVSIHPYLAWSVLPDLDVWERSVTPGESCGSWTRRPGTSSQAPRRWTRAWWA